MNVKLTAEQQQIITEQLQTGHFRTAEEVILKALQVLQESKQVASDSPNGKHSEAVREMLEFARQNRASLGGISVKQLIHEGHRL